MNQNRSFSRRAFLRGAGVALALPTLESLVPTCVAGAAAKQGEGFPLRLGFFFVPNGVHMPHWTPARDGFYFDLPKILNPLRSVKRDLLVLSGLTHDKARANSDHAGDHARSAAAFLTGAQPLKSEGSEIRAGSSIDQLIARAIGDRTRFPSLELAAEKGRQAGKCDSGYSCAYSNNISWANETTPMTNEVDPRLVFERLFGDRRSRDAAVDADRRRLRKKSILDYVLDDASALKNRVGRRDGDKLEEYLTAVRSIEQRIERSEGSFDDQESRLSVLSGYPVPSGTPATYEEHIRLLGDMAILAFRTDATRVSTFMLANEGSNRSYDFIGVSEGHHTLSHHQNDPIKLAKISDINEFHVRQFAYVAERLKEIPEGDGSLLDNCLLVYGAGISDGNRHNNENLPIIIAGTGGGSVRTGRHVKFDSETPMCNLLLSLADRMGVELPRFGDSTGRLSGLT